MKNIIKRWFVFTFSLSIVTAVNATTTTTTLHDSMADAEKKCKLALADKRKESGYTRINGKCKKKAEEYYLKVNWQTTRGDRGVSVAHFRVREITSSDIARFKSARAALKACRGAWDGVGSDLAINRGFIDCESVGNSNYVHVYYDGVCGHNYVWPSSVKLSGKSK